MSVERQFQMLRLRPCGVDRYDAGYVSAAKKLARDNQRSIIECGTCEGSGKIELLAAPYEHCCTVCNGRGKHLAKIDDLERLLAEALNDAVEPITTARRALFELLKEGDLKLQVKEEYTEWY